MIYVIVQKRKKRCVYNACSKRERGGNKGQKVKGTYVQSYVKNNFKYFYHFRL